VAEAASEGGFLGFGGVKVSDTEKATLAACRNAGDHGRACALSRRKAQHSARSLASTDTAFSEACTAFFRIMSRIGANAFEHFRRAALRSAPGSWNCQILLPKRKSLSSGLLGEAPCAWHLVGLILGWSLARSSATMPLRPQPATSLLGMDVGFSTTERTTGLAWRVAGRIEVALAATPWETRWAVLPERSRRLGRPYSSRRARDCGAGLRSGF